MNNLEKIMTPNFIEKVRNYLPIFMQDIDMSKDSISYMLISSTVIAFLEQQNIMVSKGEN